MGTREKDGQMDGSMGGWVKRQHFGNVDKVGKVLTQVLAWCFPQKATHSFSRSLCFMGWSGQTPDAAQECSVLWKSNNIAETLPPRHSSVDLTVPKTAVDSRVYMFLILLLRFSVPATSRKHSCFPSCVCPQIHSSTFFLDLPQTPLLHGLLRI